MAVFFTSDTHYHHARVIEYCERPFLDVHEMNQELVRRYNERVGAGDTVFHLGDFALGPRAHLGPTRERLNGRIILVKGNHDRSRTALLAAGFNEVHSELRLELDGVPLYLRHAPLPPDGDWKGARYMLHGHVHEKYRRLGDAVNVGVDQWQFRPITLQEALEASE